MRSAATYIIRLLLLAAAYYLTGRLGLLLTIPPGQATAVWPASGIALAGILILGPRYLPAVILGAVGTSLYHPPVIDAKALAIAATIASGAGAQAWAGYRLIRRQISLPTPLETSRDISAILFFGGIVSCAVNATIGTATIYAAGFLPTSGILFHWSTWWAGDAIGVFVFTPTLLLLFYSGAGVSPARKAVVSASLCITFLLVVYLFQAAKENERRTAQEIFDRQAHEIGQLLQKDIDEYLTLLVAVERFISSSGPLSQETFERFTLAFLERTPGIQSLSWNPRVLDRDRESYESAIARTGHPEFAIMDRSPSGEMRPATRRSVYFPVAYLTPYGRNARAHGFDTYGSDAASGNLRSLTLDRARDEGQAHTTGRISIVQAEGAYGLLIYQPVYQREGPWLSLEARRTSLLGYVAGVFVIPSMVAGPAESARRAGIDFIIRELHADRTTFLYDSSTPDNKEGDSPAVIPDAVLSATEVFSFVGSKWEIQCHTGGRSPDEPHNWSLWAVLAGGLMFTGLGGVLLLVVTARTEIIQRQVDEQTAELQRAKEVAEESSRTKSEFLANMSHELRTPMNAIIGMTDLTLNTEVTETQREHLTAVKDSSLTLLDILNDILDLSKIEAGKMELDDEIFNIREVIGKIETVYAPRAEAAGIEMTCSIADSIPTLLFGDPGRLRQIIVNLLGNALKFTKDGTVRIILAGSPGGGETMRLDVSIEDTGIGIPIEKQKSIFEAFTQADSSTTRLYGGTGLGLNISTKLVKLMGGEIGVASEEGVGSRFSFSVRLGVPDPEMLSLSPVAKPESSVTVDTAGPWRILLAEDNVVNQKVAVGILEQRGHTVQIANDGVEALDLSAKQVYDAVLMDVQMPRMDGLEATKAIRDRERTSGDHLAIIGLTARAMKGDREQFLLAGMDEYVSKPIVPEILIEAIASAVAAAPRAVLQNESPSDPELSPDHEPDWGLLLDRIGGDPELLRSIIDLFREDYPESIAAMTEAIEQNDVNALRRAAHKLKGALSTLDLETAARLAFRIEKTDSLADVEAVRAAVEQLDSEIDRYVALQSRYLDT